MEQRNVVDNFERETLSPTEIVATFPNGKATVKRLIREHEAFLEEGRQTHEDTKQFFATKVSMFDVDICTKLVMSAYYGNLVEESEEALTRLRRLLHLYEPSKAPTSGVTDSDIARAREYPIRELVKVRMNAAKCLWHDEKTASMHVYPDNHAYCFGCQKRADAIDIAMQTQGLDFVAAVKWLNRI